MNIVAKNKFYPRILIGIFSLLLLIIIISTFFFYPEKNNENIQAKIVNNQTIRAETITTRNPPESEPKSELESKKEPEPERIKIIPEKIIKKISAEPVKPVHKKMNKEQKKVPRPEVKAQAIITKPTIKQTSTPPSKSPLKKQYSKTILKNTARELTSQARQIMATDIPKAIDLLEKNSTIITPDTDYYATLANLYLRRKQFNQATLKYQHAIKLDKNKGELWIGLALSYQGAGETGKAKDAFKQAANSSHISDSLREYANERQREVRSGR